MRERTILLVRAFLVAGTALFPRAVAAQRNFPVHETFEREVNDDPPPRTEPPLLPAPPLESAEMAARRVERLIQEYEGDRAFGRRMWLSGLAVLATGASLTAVSASLFSEPQPMCTPQPMWPFTLSLCVSGAQFLGALLVPFAALAIGAGFVVTSMGLHFDAISGDNLSRARRSTWTVTPQVGPDRAGLTMALEF